MIIAADIGGTKTLIALVLPDGQILNEIRYLCAEFDSIYALLDHFLDSCGVPASQIQKLCLALPAPISDHIQLTNLDWSIDRQALQKQFPNAHIALVNDFAAAAIGAVHLGSDQLLPLYQGQMLEGKKKLVLGAGTGMGTAYLHFSHGEYRAYATEAGHISFSPQTEEEWMIYRYIHQNIGGRVSWERLLSGSGLSTLYAYFSSEQQAPPEIVRRAQQEQTAALSTMRLFAQLYGRYCGDMALAFLPQGGIYLTGGISYHLKPWLHSVHFCHAFLDKGRMSMLVKDFQVNLVLEQRTGLLGAIQLGLKIHY